jgi:hypothetical protein
LKRWEYDVRRICTRDGQTEALEKRLYDTGSRGWELVSLSPLYKYSGYLDLGDRMVGVEPYIYDGWTLIVLKREVVAK